jgi:uncharacterized repeat protein (TIGR03803 family)
MDQQGTVTVLYRFGFTDFDGTHPIAGLMEGTDGFLYGATLVGGKYALGTLFQISTAGAYRRLYSFAGPNGQTPYAPPIQDTSGVFYGTTKLGGHHSQGVIYSLNLGLPAFVILVNYTGRPGQTVNILGQGFTGASSVTFNSLPAAGFTVVSDTYMTAVVPSGATTGTIVVTTPDGVLASKNIFRILQ